MHLHLRSLKNGMNEILILFIETCFSIQIYQNIVFSIIVNQNQCFSILIYQNHDFQS